MITKVQSLPDIKELKTELVGEIVKSFAITKTAFFIREMMYQKADYIKIKDGLFGEKTAGELYTKIFEWKKSKGGA